MTLHIMATIAASERETPCKTSGGRKRTYLRRTVRTV